MKYESQSKNVNFYLQSQLKNVNSGVSYQRVPKMLKEIHDEKTGNGQAGGLEKRF